MTILAVPKERGPGERRVSVVPTVVPTLERSGFEVVVEAGAGDEAGITDAAFSERGARISSSREEVAGSPVVARVDPLDGLDLYSRDAVVVGLCRPLASPEGVRSLAGRGVTAFSLELLPRITRAQPMDALSSQATITGYKAVLLAASTLPKFLPMLTTAAGTIPPGRVLVIGAGVAGLQAIATARRLGAVVQAYDVRPTAREQVESLGAKFVDVPLEAGDVEDAGGYARGLDEERQRRQRELLADAVAASDAVITTALVPGSRAPVIVTREMVERMQPGSVIVDVAAEQGGNCELTRPGETSVEGGVTVVGALNLPATVPHDASQTYARNIASFLGHLASEGELQLDGDDEIVRETLVARGGEVVHPRVREALGLGPPAEPEGERAEQVVGRAAR